MIQRTVIHMRMIMSGIETRPTGNNGVPVGRVSIRAGQLFSFNLN
jgi:hypothetical protein